MKLAELEFFEAVVNRTARPVREVAEDFIKRGFAPKQLGYWLEKWLGKGWYQYGVSLDLGWLTEAGFEEYRKIKDWDRILGGPQ